MKYQNSNAVNNFDVAIQVI